MQHVFQPMDPEIPMINPFKMIGKDWFLITAGDENKANTMTAGWGGTGVLWGKNVIFIFVRESRYTKEFLDAKDTFSISFLDAKDRPALKYLGAVSGRDEDKIANARIHLDYEEGTPYIDEARTVILCRKLSKTEIDPEQFLDPEIDGKWYKDHDYHTMYVGEITKFMAR